MRGQGYEDMMVRGNEGTTVLVKRYEDITKVVRGNITIKKRALLLLEGTITIRGLYYY